MNVLDDSIGNEKKLTATHMMPFVWKYGLLGIVIISLIRTINFTVFSGEIEFYIKAIIGFFGFATYIVFMGLGITQYKKRNNGFISFKQGFLVTYLIGCLITLANFVATIALIYLFHDLKDYGHIASFFGLSTSYTTDVFTIILSFFLAHIGSCILGSIVSIIISLVFQKERPKRISLT